MTQPPILIRRSDKKTSIDSGKKAMKEEPNVHRSMTPLPETATTATAKEEDTDEPEEGRDKHIWWLHVEREVTIGFFETAEDGVKFLEDHELEPVLRKDGSYYAMFDTSENAYEDPAFYLFYRKTYTRCDTQETINLEKVPISYQLCSEHNE
ncbi:hypothetical protein BGX26_005711 [Mortierella sp. AD094]|nr:hypothetical protein BGX26_005711 [Mortierella sp. AD094]